MKTFLRLPVLVRLVLPAAAVLVVVFLTRSVLRDLFEAEDLMPASADIDATQVDQPQTAALRDAVATPSGLEALGAPDDPLPEPLPFPATPDPVQRDDAAETLARHVLEGGPEAFPALVTALQASGIGIIGSDNSEVAKPAEPWQGMTMQRWEVRTAAVMVLPERTVTVTLADLAAFLVSAMPQLQGAPVEQLIVKDLRALAESQAPTRRFFARFIAALGRHADSHPAYDLLRDVDPKTIQMNGVQASLILRRLSIDILMLADQEGKKGREGKKGEKTASLLDTLHGWVVPAVHAQGQAPCRLSERAQNIMDIAAFGSSIAWGGFEVGGMGMPGVMQQLGLGNLGTAAAAASTLLGYAQFMATYAALEAEVALDAPPLVRTKKMSPQTGERKQLTAIVKMNIGNAEMLNCFRAMLIAVGLDFSLPNDGPVKGARVLWYGVDGFDQAAAALHGGGEAIVQFVAPQESRVQGAGSASASPVTGAVTGEDGKVQIGVEGRGQHETISNDATEVHKSAKVRLQVALKGADLFGDLQEAAGTAAGGLVGLASLPLGVLMRTQWASTGHYTFPVTDWREGPGEWSGSISVAETIITSDSGEGVYGGGASQWQETETTRVEIELRDTISEFGAGGGALIASVNGQAAAIYDRLKTFAGWTRQSCGAVKDRTMNNTSREHAHGTSDGDAMINVSIQADGTYVVTATSEMQIDVTGTFNGAIDSFGANCVVGQKPNGYDLAPLTQGLGGLIQATGRVDPSRPDVLAGSKTENLSPGGSGSPSSGQHVKTTTWQLRRN